MRQVQLLLRLRDLLVAAGLTKSVERPLPVATSLTSSSGRLRTRVLSLAYPWLRESKVGFVLVGSLPDRGQRWPSRPRPRSPRPPGSGGSLALCVGLVSGVVAFFAGAAFFAAFVAAFFAGGRLLDRPLRSRSHDRRLVGGRRDATHQELDVR